MKKVIALVLVLVLGIVVEVANADFTFGTPINLGPTVNSSAHEGTPVMPTDGLSLFFDANRSGGYGAFDVWVITRATTDDEWGTPVNLGAPVNTSSWEGVPSISADGLSLFISSNRSGGSGGMDIWISTRETIDDPWGTPANLGQKVNSVNDDWSQSISASGLKLYFSSNRPGGSGNEDLWITMRATTDDEWSIPVNLGSPVNTSAGEINPSISVDDLSLFFFSGRPGGYGSRDIWVTTRATTDNEWRTPVNLGSPVNTSAMDQGAIFSADSSTIFFCSNRSGGYGGLDLWQVSISPVVDLNGDGIVDAADMCIMVDHWGENYSLCDIGPTPLGDGIVDVQDLVVLAEHLFEAVNDPTLVAHWPLDEAEGGIAQDSAGDNFGYVIGGPTWQPSSGQVNGAIQLDGVDDVVVAGPPLNPADGPLSVLAWVQGGAPGQTIISEPAGQDWLSLDPLTGHLMTELTSAGHSATPLQSQAVITDGNWHRIGFVWDGLYRTLYVDGIAVAEDTQDGLVSPASGFYIGTGKAMAPDTFFSGLIDDVRIYNRAVSP